MALLHVSLRFSVLLAAAVGVATGVRTSDAATAPDDPVAQRAYARCARAMAESTCVAASPGAQAADAGPLAPVVFVAGAGPVPGDVYRQLVRADARMCDLVRFACAREPGGPVCRTALKLW
jgi:hypothetical protein